MKSFFTARAAREFDEAKAWYESQHVGFGELFDLKVHEVLSRLEQFPFIGSRFGPHNRRVTVPRFPYRLVYTVIGDEVIVVGIGHLHRSPEFWVAMRKRS